MNLDGIISTLVDYSCRNFYMHYRRKKKKIAGCLYIYILLQMDQDGKKCGLSIFVCLFFFLSIFVGIKETLVSLTVLLAGKIWWVGPNPPATRPQGTSSTVERNVKSIL